jgi:hypothetical protein
MHLNPIQSSSRFACSLAAFFGLTYPTIDTGRKMSAARKWLGAVTKQIPFG